MEQMTITAKIQISVNADSKVLLDKTMSVYSDACNFVSDHVFRTHDLKQFSLNKVLYSTLREKFGLKSQMAQSVFKTVIARYKTILENQNEWIQPSFKKPQYDLVLESGGINPSESARNNQSQSVEKSQCASLLLPG
jgi:predicted transposase